MEIKINWHDAEFTLPRFKYISETPNECIMIKSDDCLCLMKDKEGHEWFEIMMYCATADIKGQWRDEYFGTSGEWVHPTSDPYYIDGEVIAWTPVDREE